jgi:DNA-directed RNA polymerase specialized sigma24 family protein
MPRRRELPAIGDFIFDEYPSLEESIPHSLQGFVRSSMSKLDVMDRDLLLMYYHERLTYREIGERLSILWDEDYDRRHAFYYVKRARDRLREVMEEEFSGLNSNLRQRYERIRQ